MDEASRIAAKLSEAQKRALRFLSATQWESPYELKRQRQKGGFTVLEALVRRGLADERRPAIGGLFSPHTEYAYRASLLDLAVRQHLMEAGE